MSSCLSLDFLYRASRINGFGMATCQINSIANTNPIMPSPTPLTSSEANSPNHARADSPADSGTDSEPDSNANSPVDVHQRLARKRRQSRERARKYRQKKSKAPVSKGKLSKEEKRIKNRFAQREHR